MTHGKETNNLEKFIDKFCSEYEFANKIHKIIAGSDFMDYENYTTYWITNLIDKDYEYAGDQTEFQKHVNNDVIFQMCLKEDAKINNIPMFKSFTWAQLYNEVQIN